MESRKETPLVDDERLAAVPVGGARPGIGVGDLDFVRAAACVLGSILVTYDEPLMQALATEGLPTSLGFSVVTPNAALELAVHSA